MSFCNPACFYTACNPEIHRCFQLWKADWWKTSRARRHLLSDRVVKFVRSLKSLLFCIGRTLRALAAWQHYVKFCGKTHTGGNNIKQNFACVEFLSELKNLNLNLLDPQILIVTCMCTKCVGTLRFCPPNRTDATEYVWTC